MVIWVVVASKYGSTREVADAIAAELRSGHDVQVHNADKVASFEAADAVVLGSAIYAGRCLEPARRLVAKRAEELASRPTWLFSVRPVGDPPKPDEAGPDGIADALEATHARARGLRRQA